MTDDPVFDIRGDIKWPGLELHVEVESAARRVALVGASGSGKSTLLRCLAGLEPSHSLEVAFGGITWSDRGFHVPSRDRRVGWVPQHSELFPHLSAFENMSYAGTDRDARRIAEALEIDHILDRRPSTLSGGERQRVALGRALSRDPDLLLLDEPFAALDRDLRSRVKSWVVDACEQRDLPFLLVTHDQRDISDIADEVWEIAGGEVRRADDAT